MEDAGQEGRTGETTGETAFNNGEIFRVTQSRPTPWILFFIFLFFSLFLLISTPNAGLELMALRSRSQGSHELKIKIKELRLIQPGSPTS